MALSSIEHAVDFVLCGLHDIPVAFVEGDEPWPWLLVKVIEQVLSELRSNDSGIAFQCCRNLQIPCATEIKLLG